MLMDSMDMRTILMNLTNCSSIFIWFLKEILGCLTIFHRCFLCLSYQVWLAESMVFLSLAFVCLSGFSCLLLYVEPSLCVRKISVCALISIAWFENVYVALCDYSLYPSPVRFGPMLLIILCSSVLNFSWFLYVHLTKKM